MFHTQNARHGTRWYTLCAVILLSMLARSGSVMGAPAADLDQIRNSALDECGAGDPCPPSGCTYSSGTLQWVNGNAGAETAHYAEGMSIAYRVRMTEVPTGKPITITLGYDIKHSDHHAIDYLSHFQRLEPHCAGFSHNAEVIDPRVGVPAVSAVPLSGSDTFPIPAPSSTGSPVTGQPTTSFNSLPAGQRVMTIYNGDITAIAYTAQGSLTANASETRINVTFTASDPTVVLAWGGHIASRLDWGFDSNGQPLSAAGISGSPYHMRLVSWTWNPPPKSTNLGNQDRSLAAAAVIPPPTGACCVGLTCIDNLTEDQCTAQGGTFHEGSACVPGLCGCAITCPADAQRECGQYTCASPPPPSDTGTATCNGDGCTATFTDTCVSACGNTGTITRHWTCAAGTASASCDQIITIVDTTAPTLGDPGANVTIDCPATPTFTPPTASDTCGTATVVLDSDVTTPSGTCAGAYTQTKTWHAVDDCGNMSASKSQAITVQDITPPVIDCTSTAPVVADEGDGCFAKTVTLHATVTDTCCIDPAGVGNFAVSFVGEHGHAVIEPVGTCTKTSSNGGMTVDVSCTFRISDLPRCPVTVSASIDATDCCGNAATQCVDDVGGI